MTHDEILAQLKADREKFDRRMARRRRLALWSLIPHGLGGAAAGVGISCVLNDSGSRLTTATLLIVGYVLIVGTSWIQPVIVERGERSKA